jgi:hypothetical protein
MLLMDDSTVSIHRQIKIRACAQARRIRAADRIRVHRNRVTPGSGSIRTAAAPISAAA